MGFAAVVQVLPVSLELTVLFLKWLPVLIPKPSTQSAEPSLFQHNHGHKKRGHYITGHIPNCADKAHHPFPFIAKIVSAYFSQ